MKEILEKVLELSAKHSTLWFRGHSSTNYKLNSGLYRIDSDKKTILEYENNIYNAFTNLGSNYVDNFYSEKEWNTLFMMQHYGMHTRLLDWTSSFSTALYFANLNRKANKTAAIWAIDPIKLNNHCYNLYERQVDPAYAGIGHITLDSLPNRIANYTSYFNENIHIKSFALMPRRSNERLLLQSGFFTVQGTEALPLEEEYKDFINDFIYKIELPPETYSSCIDYLKINGVNYYSLFGGIDGLCHYISKELLNIKLNNI
ncbi:FRG domain-containing protein [uncultured Rummeliibacillus sp.]|uniref:FRG domain-containing protein n=1 Tax=uncultured Rummeliibacillus sp. TaxID=762292 RepID=UPI002604E296|nr:FRG domain-containing protein [uncultured Rummeliibacillus sp.]